MIKYYKEQNMKKINKLLNPLYTETNTEKPGNSKYCVQQEMSNDGRSRRKCVYIRESTHGIIARIVKISPNPGLTLGRLVDFILSEYLEANKEDINCLYRRDKGNLIE